MVRTTPQLDSLRESPCWAQDDKRERTKPGVTIGRTASPWPVLDYRLTVLIDGGLNHISESALIVFIDRNEPEGLLSAGERRQHFGCAKHCSRIGQEHQVDARALT